MSCPLPSHSPAHTRSASKGRAGRRRRRRHDTNTPSPPPSQVRRENKCIPISAFEMFLSSGYSSPNQDTLPRLRSFEDLNSLFSSSVSEQLICSYTSSILLLPALSHSIDAHLRSLLNPSKAHNTAALESLIILGCLF